MKSKHQKQMEALARRQKDLEFWQKSLKDAKFESQVDLLARKIKTAEREIKNLRLKLGLSA